MSKSKIYFYQAPSDLKNRQALKKYIDRLFKHEKRQLKSLNYIFCSDSEILRINKEFLKHDSYTDIITFEFSAKKSPVEAEVYISVERVKENAGLLGESFKKELHRVIFHGALHLCGYKDKTRSERKVMREKEDYFLKKYF